MTATVTWSQKLQACDINFSWSHKLWPGHINCVNLNFRSPAQLGWSIKTNGLKNSNFHKFFLEVQNNSYVFLNLRHLYGKSLDTPSYPQKYFIWAKLVSLELNHISQLVYGFSWGVKAHRSYTMCIRGNEMSSKMESLHWNSLNLWNKKSTDLRKFCSTQC